MGVTLGTLQGWAERHEEVAYAFKCAEDTSKTPQTMVQYVYGRLPPDMKKVWDKIAFYEDMEGGLDKVEALLGKDPRVRQYMFIHALCSTCFNTTRACAMVNLPLRTLSAWMRDDQFVDLIQEVEFHKKNFFEQAMLDLVAVRNPLAVLHVNKTKNADRGYGDKLVIEANVQHTHRIVPLEKLALPLETLLAIEQGMARVPDSRQKAVNGTETGLATLPA
jgi:hypothetical protein